MLIEKVTTKTPAEITLIKQGGHYLGLILKKISQMVKPGINTGELEEAADKMMKEIGGKPSFRGYCSKGECPYPTILCTSIDEEVVHSPSKPFRVLKEGQIIGIDVGMQWPKEKGFFTDTAATVPVGRISKSAQNLLDVTQKALAVGIRMVRPGAKISDIGRAIEQYIKPHKMGIVRDLVGHGVGYEVHEEPRIPNYFDPLLSAIEIKEGMVLAIEPMITLGDWRIITGNDGWSIRTADGSLSAHFEHTVVVTKNGNRIVTI